MKTNQFVSISGLQIYGVRVLSDGETAVARKPTEDELEAGMKGWRWAGRAACPKSFTGHDEFWDEEWKTVASKELSEGPSDHNAKIRAAVFSAWLSVRTGAIMFALSPKGQAVQARNAALIAKAKQMNAVEGNQ